MAAFGVGLVALTDIGGGLLDADVSGRQTLADGGAT